MSNTAAFNPLKSANGLAPPTVATVTAAGTAVHQVLPTSPVTATGNPTQVAIYNAASADAQINFGTAAMITANPATPTTGFTVPKGALIVLTIDPSYTDFSAVIGALGLGSVLVWLGEGL